MSDDVKITHQRSFRSRIEIERMAANARRQRGHLAGAGGSIPRFEDYFDRVYPAVRFAGGNFEFLEILARKDQVFTDYATDFERRWSVLVNPANRFIPVLDADYLVVGHYGSVFGGYKTEAIIPLGLIMKHPLALRILDTSSMNRMLDTGVHAFVHTRQVRPPTGWELVDVGNTEEDYRVITSLSGQILTSFLYSTGFVEESEVSPLDLIDIGRLTFKLSTKIVGATLKTLSRRAAIMAAGKSLGKGLIKALDGPSIAAAKEAAEKLLKESFENLVTRISRKFKLIRGYDPRMGIPEEHLDAMIAAAREANVIPIFRANKAAAIPLIRKGAHGKPMWAKFKTSAETGVLTAKEEADVLLAYANGHFVVGADGVARRIVTRGGKQVEEVMKIKNPFWTVKEGQVLAPDGKPIVGDYDLLGVAPLHSPGRSVALVPENTAAGDWSGPDVKKFLGEVNRRMDEPRVLHGAQDQYGGIAKYMGLTDDTAYAVLPDGRTVILEGRKAQEEFYEAIGRQAKSPGAPSGEPGWPLTGIKGGKQ